MNHQILTNPNPNQLADLFNQFFSASENEKEGELVGNLAKELAIDTDNQNIISMVSYDNEFIIAILFFSRLYFKEDRLIYLLSPMAVKTKYQNQGIGSSLINFGINEMKKRNVEVLITYGDPNFYNKAGFLPLSEKTIKASHKLSMPIGWLGQSINHQPIPTIKEKPICVEAFNNLNYW